MSELHAQLTAFMARHKLSAPALARHAGVRVSTLRAILANPDRRPLYITADALRWAMERGPPPPKRPRHADVIAARWGRDSSNTIGQDIGVSGARVRAIAKRIGLTGAAAP